MGGAKEDHGIELAIVGSWHGKALTSTRSTCSLGARMAGLETATYIVLPQHPEVVTTGLERRAASRPSTCRSSPWTVSCEA